MELELNHSFDLEKDCWDTIYLERIQEACNPGAKADIAAVVMQEGLAHVCLITQSMTITKSRIERTFAKKSQVHTCAIAPSHVHVNVCVDVSFVIFL